MAVPCFFPPLIHCGDKSPPTHCSRVWSLSESDTGAVSSNLCALPLSVWFHTHRAANILIVSQHLSPLRCMKVTWRQKVTNLKVLQKWRCINKREVITIKYTYVRSLWISPSLNIIHTSGFTGFKGRILISAFFYPRWNFWNHQRVQDEHLSLNLGISLLVQNKQVNTLPFGKYKLLNRREQMCVILVPLVAKL